jgi:hypothetical protein
VGLGNIFGTISQIAGAIAPVVGLVNPALGIGIGTIGGAFERFAPQPSPQVYGDPGYSAPPAVYYPTPAQAQLGFLPGEQGLRFADPVGFAPFEQFNGGGMVAQPVGLPAVAGAAGAVVAMSARLASAVLRVAGRMGVSLVSFAGLSRFAGRLWRSITSFARRHPNISSIALLTSLGFAAEEAAEFLAWGTTRRRRRRGGISGRDLRITRRTLRRLSSIRVGLGGGVFRSRRARRGSDGVVVARAG